MFGTICPCGIEGFAWLGKREMFVLSDSACIYEHAGHRVTTIEPVAPPPPPPSKCTKLGECVDRLAARGVSKDEMLRILEISYSEEPTVEEGDAQISAVVLEHADKNQSDF